MTTPLSLVYQALCGGAFNTIANIKPVNIAAAGMNPQFAVNIPAILSFVLGDENTPAQPDSVIAPIVQAFLQNKAALAANAVATTQALLTEQQASQAAINTNITTLSATGALPSI